MQITIHELDGVPGPQDNSWVDAVLAHLDADSGRPAGVLIGRSLGLGPGLLITFGPAPAAGFAAGPVTAGPGATYELVIRHTGSAGGRPRYLRMVTFTGPRSPEWCAAFDRSGEERLWPAVRDVPGLVGDVVGSTSDGGRTVLGLAESVEALEAGAAAVLSTELLPWERPEQLTGPDAATVVRLLHADLPATVPSA
jgi:hypothetical protein